MPPSSTTISWPFISFISLLSVLLVLAVIYFHQPKPCQYPITYRIGKVDEKFGITPQEFGGTVNRAAAMWGKPLSRDLFREDPQGRIEVNLIYDYRQEATDRLRKLNYKIDDSKNSYEELNARLDNFETRLNLQPISRSWSFAYRDRLPNNN